MSPADNEQDQKESAPSDATMPDGETLSASPAEIAETGDEAKPRDSDDAAPVQNEQEEAPSPAPELQRILALDTALGACSAAILDQREDRLLSIQTIELARGHAEALLPMIERAMQEAEIGFHSLTRIATTVGPGSFTGLRVAISAARGIGLVCNKPVVGVSTLAAFCAPYVSETDTTPVISAIDALHGNLYFQMIGAGGRMLVSPRVASLGEAIRLCALGPVKITGPAANLLASRWPVPDVPAPALVDPRPAPDILWVARLGGAANPETAKPRPLYLKAPDAHPQTAHRLPRQ